MRIITTLMWTQCDNGAERQSLVSHANRRLVQVSRDGFIALSTTQKSGVHGRGTTRGFLRASRASRVQLSQVISFSTSSVLTISPNANPKPLSPELCCRRFALPQASSTSKVSYPRLKALLAVVSQQQSVMTPQTISFSIFFSSNIFPKSVLMKAS